MSIIDVPPRFRVATGAPNIESDSRTIVISKSSAFGDGRHESTQMCLQALGVFAPRSAFRMLDVGSGSGILSIAAAKLGGQAIGVEIDGDANVVAVENARRNGVSERVAFGDAWPSGRYEVVVANILRTILLALADDIVARLATSGLLILSGLVSTDTPEILGRYVPLLSERRPQIFTRGPWCSLVWRTPVQRCSG